MKKILLFLLVATAATAANAQELAPDQNPNYRISLNKYTGNQQNLQNTMNTTVQNTYKAYDWRTARTERKQERVTYRRQRNLFDAYNYNYGSGYYNNGYNNGYNFYYNDRYNRYGSSYQWRPSYGRRWHW